jgi:hypothetical protein
MAASGPSPPTLERAMSLTRPDLTAAATALRGDDADALTRRLALCRLGAFAAAGTALAMGAAPAPAQGLARRRLDAVATDPASGRELYRQVHEQQLDAQGRVSTELTRYLSPEGREIARKTLDYRAHRTLPVFRMEQPGVKTAEGLLTHDGQSVEVFRRRAETETRRTLPLEAGQAVAADSGFDHLLVDAFDALVAGRTVPFSLVVAGQLDRYRFRARATGQAEVDGEPALQLRVEPDSLLRMLVDPIELTYARADRRLMRYVGVSNVQDPAKGEVYKRVALAWARPTPLAG